MFDRLRSATARLRTSTGAALREPEAVARWLWQFNRLWAVLVLAAAALTIVVLALGAIQYVRMEHTRQAYDNATAGGRGAQVDAAAELEPWRAALPGAAEVQAVLESIGARPQEYGVQLRDIASRQSPEASGRWARQEYEFVLKGSFDGARRFIADLLAKHPALALEGLEVQRASVNDSAVTCRVRTTLHFRP
jgi:hypothetical protein